MNFFTHFNFKSKPEKLSSEHCELFDDAGYIPLEKQIQNLIQAGENLELTRRAMFPGFEEDEVDVDDIDLDDLDHIDRESLIKANSDKMKNYTSKQKTSDVVNSRASGEKSEDSSEAKSDIKTEDKK